MWSEAGCSNSLRNFQPQPCSCFVPIFCSYFYDISQPLRSPKVCSYYKNVYINISKNVFGALLATTGKTPLNHGYFFAIFYLLNFTRKIICTRVNIYKLKLHDKFLISIISACVPYSYNTKKSNMIKRYCLQPGSIYNYLPPPPIHTNNPKGPYGIGLNSFMITIPISRNLY